MLGRRLEAVAASSTRLSNPNAQPLENEADFLRYSLEDEEQEAREDTPGNKGVPPAAGGLAGGATPALTEKGREKIITLCGMP
jgi:hypothetical protein